ncbi:MAG: hypothetical protein H7234_04450 [Herminiimonas sp.]|nr:hypothetical protein [Herminiimonas sp.]
MHRFNWARTHAAEIHDAIQFCAATLACIALLIFMAVSGRDPDDPVIRMMADVGAVLAQSELMGSGQSSNNVESVQHFNAITTVK